MLYPRERDFSFCFLFVSSSKRGRTRVHTVHRHSSALFCCCACHCTPGFSQPAFVSSHLISCWTNKEGLTRPAARKFDHPARLSRPGGALFQPSRAFQTNRTVPHSNGASCSVSCCMKFAPYLFRSLLYPSPFAPPSCPALPCPARSARTRRFAHPRTHAYAACMHACLRECASASLVTSTVCRRSKSPGGWSSGSSSGTDSTDAEAVRGAFPCPRYIYIALNARKIVCECTYKGVVRGGVPKMVEGCGGGRAVSKISGVRCVCARS